MQKTRILLAFGAELLRELEHLGLLHDEDLFGVRQSTDGPGDTHGNRQVNCGDGVPCQKEVEHTLNRFQRVDVVREQAQNPG